MQSGFLRAYLLLIVGVTVIGGAVTLAIGGDLNALAASSEVRFYEALVAGAIVFGLLWRQNV